MIDIYADWTNESREIVKVFNQELEKLTKRIEALELKTQPGLRLKHD